ncbi:hypothetical protein B0H66DRAFT_582359 [Apodospora peruviana]|uniref:PLD phosphodiesterase domain-containing protein n=1 Tax=Apodospora peruviana TaxID=516989 RepID=A0AAE0I667_9PEZI|nr:hypothetical protein B0H66DRAFT_582359 [Apodospora peruviana]
MSKHHSKSAHQHHISDRLVELCTSNESVSSLLAAFPSREPGDVWEELYDDHVKPKSSDDEADGVDGFQVARQNELSRDELKRAAKCGNWGPTQPSDLFLKIYHDALCTLEENPLHAMVSPSLMGSCGVVPLTIISVIPDIVRHMSNVIARAEREVFLATNYWQDSVASKFLTNGIRELDQRAAKRGVRVVVKILYDRGSPRQLVEPHYLVSEKTFTGKNVNLPHPSEIPNVDMQVMNYHTPIVGTFHSKYMIVDRKIALLQSNNIQDNDNLEMMIHLEGPIVDSFYDMALLSWNKKLEPPLPSYNSPAAQGGVTCFGKSFASLFESDGTLKGSSVVVDPARIQLKEAFGNSLNHRNGGVYKPGAVDSSAELTSSDELTGPSTTQGSTHPHPLRAATHSTTRSNGSTTTTAGQANHYRSDTPNGAADRPAENYLSKGEQAISSSRLQEPIPSPPANSINGDTSLPEHTANDPHYDDDIAGEVARVQNAVSPSKSGQETRMQAVSRLLNHTVNKGFPGTAPECPPGDEMTPYIPHPVHEPFPIALVNRSPYGLPTHKAVSNPQNAAWLSALRYATRSVFIQSPTLNAEPLIPAIREACERGVDVYCYICLGYNDAGELLPHQGGHNEMVAHNLYKSLSAAARERLHYFWYVAKDQTKPLLQASKKRSCHIKLMIVDEHVGIMGNGNQDTQSWFHSQEINVMLDSADICRSWIDGIRRNQNTHVYGALDKNEGIWRDGKGKEADGAVGVDPGRFSWLKGMAGAVRRVKGTGGF